MTKKTSKHPTDTVETASDVAARVLTKALAAIEAEIDRISAGGTVVGENETIRIAQLGQKAAPIWAELRKTAKAEKDLIREISPEVVRSWVQMQTPEYRARFRKDIDAMDAASRRSVLG